ncbi:MAG: type II toxin-antitoxin system death-on-curing family toxin [Candidatus Hydrogenedentes bacterium]|nr:type II toxin-antitoxin system death-on-curing family toxin [Candidatus Hydrogenedentota bacterium]
MIRWLRPRDVRYMHQQLILKFGGLDGLWDAGLLESALARPQQLHAYKQEDDLCRHAGAYGYGLRRNHPFLDGNKRVALMVMYTFLQVNGLQLHAPEVDAFMTLTRLASGSMSETELVKWLRRNSSPQAER